MSSQEIWIIGFAILVSGALRALTRTEEGNYRAALATIGAAAIIAGVFTLVGMLLAWLLSGRSMPVGGF
ncbi:MAG: hypothetical protein M3176_00970 [Chloroflexota bacterium]|nr:hypothetical protein [Chloroflexota bacterium]